MKKIYTCFILVLIFAMGTKAQVINPVTKYPVSHQDLADWKRTHLPKLDNTNRTIYEMYIDYAAANFDDAGYAWFFNTSYVAADTAGQNYGYMNYIAVAIKSIAGYTDPADILNTYTDWNTLGFPDSLPSYVKISVDSVFVHVGQENNSGENDTLVMQIVKVTGQAPTTSSQVLWQQRDSFNAPISYTNEWTTDQPVLVYTPAYTAVAGQKVAAVLKYYNKNKQDTLIVTAQFVDNGLGGADNPSSFITSYVRPCYLPNIYWTGQLTYSDGTYFAAADWDIWFKVTLDDDVNGIIDNFDNLMVHYITPNPASSKASIWFGLAKPSDVTINLLDISGKYIKTIKAGKFGAGSFLEDLNVNSLNSGLYLVSVQADNNTPVLSKLVVSK